MASLTTFFGYFIVAFSQGHGWGYRFFHPALGALPLLATYVVLRTPENQKEENGGKACLRFAGSLALLSLVVLTPLRFCQVESFIGRHLSQRPPLDSGQNELCFIRVRDGYYAGDLVQNDPFLRGRTVFLISKGPQWESVFMSELFQHAVPRGGYDGDSVWLLDPAKEGKSADKP